MTYIESGLFPAAYVRIASQTYVLQHILVASEDPVSVAVCLSSPEAGDILHGRPDASSVTMQFSLVHEARNSAAPLISDRTSCIREDKQDLRIYFGCCMLPCRSDQQQSINLSFESKFIR